MNRRKILELAVLGVLACAGLGFAWAEDEAIFAVVFAAEAAWAAVEAAYTYLSDRAGRV
jgi:hypothetical protein